MKSDQQKQQEFWTSEGKRAALMGRSLEWALEWALHPIRPQHPLATQWVAEGYAWELRKFERNRKWAEKWGA